MNRLDFIAKQLTSTPVNAPTLKERGIAVIAVPSLLSLAKRRRFLMSVEAATADPTVTFIVFVGSHMPSLLSSSSSSSSSSSPSSSTLPPTAAAAASIAGLDNTNVSGNPLFAAAMLSSEYFCQGADETEFASSEVAVPLGTRGKQIKRPKGYVRSEPFFMSPTISEVVEAIDACPKVTIAAVTGQCVAEGAELILACDYRVSSRTATFSFDQIKTLGLTPCAGGTQRLPRAVGIQTAVHWITTGKNISAANALAKGLIDFIISPDPALDGVAAAADGDTPLPSSYSSSSSNGPFKFFATRESLADAAVMQVISGAGPRASAPSTPSSSLPSSSHPISIGKRRLSATMGKIPFAIAANVVEAICRRDMNARMPKGFDAPAHALRAVMGYRSGDFTVGLANERAVFEEVYDSAQSHAMRHLSAAKARAALGPAAKTMNNWSSAASASSQSAMEEAADPYNSTTGPNAIHTIGIVGSGVMGSSIAACFLAAGFKVVIVGVDATSTARCQQRLLAIFKPQLERRRITQPQLDARMRNLTSIGGSGYKGAIAQCDIVIEAVYEDEKLKQSIFRELDLCCKPNCIIASNTASVDINKLAGVTQRPSRVVGIHFFSPAHIMQLVEIVRGASTSDETVLRLLHLTRRIHKIGVVVGNAFGFVSNRLAIRGVFQAVSLVEEGAFPYQVDAYIKSFGFANGVFEMQDMAGLDVAAALLAAMPHEQKMGRSVSTIPRELMARGRFGIKTGKGWYTYDADEPTKPKSDIEVERLCIATSDKKGIKRRTITQKEATYRFLFHIVNEAALLLEQGVAVRPSDIDLIFVLGFGFPYFRGGPCYVADQMGIGAVIEKMQMFAACCGRDTFPAPCKFLVDMAKNKKRFSDFNQ